MLTAAARGVGAATRRFLEETGAIWGLVVVSLDRMFLGPLRGERMRLGATIAQTARAGAGSLPLVALISFLVGMILALQSLFQLQKLGAESLVARSQGRGP